MSCINHKQILNYLKIPVLFGVILIFVMTLVPLPANAMKSGRAPLETRTLTAVDFGVGSLIIPMDTAYQNTGMWKAYGLLYRLLSNNIPVHWAIANPKTFNGVDFSATTSDLRTNTANGTPSYSGGPFIIDSAYAAQATSIIQTWWSANSNLPVVHKATAAFTANTDTTLKSAPRIAEDVENAKIAYGYFNAAGIPDMNGNTWTNSSPNILTQTQIANGALFQSGLCSERNYDIFVTPHNGGYTYSKTDPTNLGTRYYAALDYFNYQGGGWTALCHSILSNENNLVDLYNNSNSAVRALFYSPVNGGLLTRNGFPAIQNKGDKGSWTVIPSSASLPIAQAVTTTALQDLPGGAVQSWLTTQEQYYSNTERIAYFTNGGNQYDHIIAGTYHDGTGGGKIIFIGGHEFSTNTPYLSNADAPYLRMFYNSLFFNGTAVAKLDVTTSPHQVPLGQDTAFKINVINTGGSAATSAQNVSMVLESGVTYQSMDSGYPIPVVSTDGQGRTVLTWSALGDIPSTSTGLVINVRATYPTVGTFKLMTVTGSYGDVYGEGFSFNFCRTVQVYQPPTASRLQSFVGAAKDAKIRLDWETGNELDIVGFNVWRSQKRDGTYRVVNAKLIPAKNIGQLSGAAYTFRDKTAKAGKTYFYKIEILSATQAPEWSDIRRVRVP